jgi:hypothetical protein
MLILALEPSKNILHSLRKGRNVDVIVPLVVRTTGIDLLHSHLSILTQDDKAIHTFLVHVIFTVHELMSIHLSSNGLILCN